LTPREWQVAGLLREGLTNQQIADLLGVSLNTVKFHISEVLSKLGYQGHIDWASLYDWWRPAR
jgi:non-specific serine/threonine protein kinase